MRRDKDGKVRRYAHLGTGNYNPSTARFYTDLSLFTHDPKITEAVHYVFNFLTAYSERAQFGPLSVAPLNLGKNCVALIEREAAHARAGRPAFIVAKVNSLLDNKIIQALYAASRAGVDIELIVRGGCALRPGIRGVSGRIHVRSIVGRFLEHSRIFYFANGGGPEVYLGSADWMPRNLYERVEVMFRLKDPSLCQHVSGTVLAPYLADTEKARILRPDGTYVRAHKAGLNHRRNGTRFSVQEFLMDLSEKSGDAIAENGLSHLLKSKSSPAFEILSKKWHEPRPA